MLLSCPHCGFSKTVDPGRIPDGIKKVVCPRCKEAFSLPGQETEIATEPSAMPATTVAAPLEAAAQELLKAGFWIRVIASLIDSTLAGLAQFAAIAVLGLTAANLSGGIDPDGGGAFGILTTLFSIVFGVVYSVFFTGYCGQTPGKMLLRIKVVRTSGAEIGYGRAFLREVPGKFLSGILLGIGYLMVAFDERKQGLHDRIADSYVIKL